MRGPLRRRNKESPAAAGTAAEAEGNEMQSMLNGSAKRGGTEIGDGDGSLHVTC